MNTNTPDYVGPYYDESTNHLNHRSDASSAADSSSKRKSTEPPTVPPRVYTGHRYIPSLRTVTFGNPSAMTYNAEYGPGSMEYELAVDYLRRSQSRPISTHQRNYPPSIIVAPRTGPNSYASHHQIIHVEEEVNKNEDEKTETCDAIMTQPAPREQYLFSGSIPIEDIDIEKQQFVITTGSLFFLFGFLLMPLWWLGSYYPRYSNSKIEQRWRCYNRMMSIASALILFACLAIIIWAFA
ncbi:hypothetical protein K7432_017851 [Basidiobolus ranarum]|uniref:Uncharacterized protein n=1 Tax=Basidiobolus ranarum TaxID=34480 RepID=A0ABR2VKW2_9FUNG